MTLDRKRPKILAIGINKLKTATQCNIRFLSYMHEDQEEYFERDKTLFQNDRFFRRKFIEEMTSFVEKFQTNLLHPRYV